MIFLHEDAPPAGPKFAEGMKYNQRFIQPLVENILHLESLHLLPEMCKIYRFYIYTVSRDVHVNGNSLILRTAECDFFVIEIACNYEYDGSPRIYLTIEPYNGPTEDLVFRGRVWDSGLGLIYSALHLIDRLSFYFRYEYNSMRFAEKLLTLLGLGFYRCMRDHERVLLMSYGHSAAEIFLDLYVKMPRPRRPEPSVYMMTEIKTLEKAFF